MMKKTLTLLLLFLFAHAGVSAWARHPAHIQALLNNDVPEFERLVTLLNLEKSLDMDRMLIFYLRYLYDSEQAHQYATGLPLELETLKYLVNQGASWQSDTIWSLLSLPAKVFTDELCLYLMNETEMLKDTPTMIAFFSLFLNELDNDQPHVWQVSGQPFIELSSYDDDREKGQPNAHLFSSQARRGQELYRRAVQHGLDEAALETALLELFPLRDGRHYARGFIAMTGSLPLLWHFLSYSLEDEVIRLALSLVWHGQAEALALVLIFRRDLGYAIFRGGWHNEEEGYILQTLALELGNEQVIAVIEQAMRRH